MIDKEILAQANKRIIVKGHDGEYHIASLDEYRPASKDWRGSYPLPRAKSIKSVPELANIQELIVVSVFIDDLVHLTPEIAEEIKVSTTSGGPVDERLTKTFFVFCGEDTQVLHDFNNRKRDAHVTDVVNSGAGDGQSDFPTQPIAPPTSPEPVNESREKSREERKAEKRSKS